MRKVFPSMVAALVMVGLTPLASIAAGGPIGIDRPLAYDNAGIWKRRNQMVLQDGVVLLTAAAALVEGDNTRLGHTAWQAIDSLVIGAISAEALKLTFSRARPAQTDDANAWFQGKGHKSFPSGEVTAVASAITPFVLEYGPGDPAVYALELLPLYDAVARTKVRAHWQSDVLAGFALGTAVGYYAHGRSSSLSVGILPHGVTVGWHADF